MIISFILLENFCTPGMSSKEDLQLFLSPRLTSRSTRAAQDEDKLGDLQVLSRLCIPFVRLFPMSLFSQSCTLRLLIHLKTHSSTPDIPPFLITVDELARVSSVQENIASAVRTMFPCSPSFRIAWIEDSNGHAVDPSAVVGVVLVDREKVYATPSPASATDVCSELCRMQDASHNIIIHRIKDMQENDRVNRDGECSFLVLVIGTCVGSERPVRSEFDSYFRSCATRMASKQFTFSSEHQLQWCFSRLPLIVCDGAQLLHNQLKLHLRATSERVPALSESDMTAVLNSAAAFTNPNEIVSKLELMARACSAGSLRTIKPKEMDVLCTLASSMGPASVAAYQLLTSAIKSTPQLCDVDYLLAHDSLILLVQPLWKAVPSIASAAAVFLSAIASHRHHAQVLAAVPQVIPALKAGSSSDNLDVQAPCLRVLKSMIKIESVCSMLKTDIKFISFLRSIQANKKSSASAVYASEILQTL